MEIQSTKRQEVKNMKDFPGQMRKEEVLLINDSKSELTWSLKSFK